MIKNLLGVIDATTYRNELEDLTINRSMAAIPFAGRYRLIDFILSNMVNSGIESVAIFPRYQYRSLMDHLGSGKQWDLNRKRDGLFFFPASDLDLNEEIGSFKQFQNNMDYFLRSTQKYTLIANSYTVCNIDYNMILKRHIEADCDITEVRNLGKSLEMFILETSLLIDLITNHKKTGYLSILDVVRDHRHSLKICDYEYRGYVSVVDSIKKYYTHSMELLQPTVWKQLFLQSDPIYTKVKDEPPTKYTKNGVVKNSIIANGCIIEGHVENSIISRAVKIGKGTIIKNSIIMQKSLIGEDCVLDSVIIDKDVRVESNVKLQGSEISPYVVRKGTIQGALMRS
ncbi:glucose-1-phosphate adenylyltransferase subunit GlgD [Cytobacillus sp. S13-E01]|uniref:glucose-1-phosphate adenylyltransferase subunit GlgD n=1 Tax=Cytobacillus sp. S13-E01 TaxID=3031326 RepID=UPI0023D7FE79|nr:glucose-1-phosphate adenylyltransferase subunit GlgD [Cytobacillus sp. S13-E01]MDF0728399.1 glucose-1-phosphate adenylyltransferase subunit GlgD [Cytobacillus sp. S13-E01]